MFHQFRSYKSFITISLIFRAIPIPTVFTIRTYKDNSFFICNLRLSLPRTGTSRIGALEDTAVDVRDRRRDETNRKLSRRAIEAGQFPGGVCFLPSLNLMQMRKLRHFVRPGARMLCDYYLDYYNKAFARNIEKVDPDFMRELLLYDWKGNVRELKNIFERCFLFSQGNILEKHVELQRESTSHNQSWSCIYLKE